MIINLMGRKVRMGMGMVTVRDSGVGERVKTGESSMIE